MKKILLSITLSVIAAFSIAQQRTEADAAAIAKAFMQNNGYEFNITKSVAPAKVRAKKAGEIVPYYIFNDTQKGGFVIVGGQEAMSDILAYSTEECFDMSDLPPVIEKWLEIYSLCAVTAADEPEKSMAEKKAAAKAFAKSNFSKRQNIEPLLGEIKYNQGEPYNRNCPTLTTSNGSTSKALTGCTQTAQAMLMRYWKHPERPMGYKSYTFTRPDATNQYQTLTVDFDEEEPYDWDNILPRYEGHSYTDEQADAIARLMYHCGVANDADYGLSVTLAAISRQGLIDHFGYADDIVIDSYQYYKETSNGDNLFLASLIDEIGQRRPIIAGGWDTSGASHYYIIDGYDINNLLHFNLGWNGSSNGYYEVVPTPKVPYGYNMYIVRNIHPEGRFTPTSPVRKVVVEAALGDFNEQSTNIKSALSMLDRESKYSESLICIVTADCEEEAENHLEGLNNIQGVLVDRCDTVTGTITTSTVAEAYNTRFNTDAPASIDIDAMFHADNTMKVSVASLFPKDINNADYRYVFVYTEDNVKIGGITYNYFARGTFPDNKGFENSLPANIEGDKEYIFEEVIPLPLEIGNINNVTLTAMMIDAKSGAIVNANTLDLKQVNEWRKKQMPAFFKDGKVVSSGTTVETYDFDTERKRMYVPVQINTPLYEPMEIELTAEVDELGKNAEVQLGETAGATSVIYSLAPHTVDSTMTLYLNITDEFKSSNSSVKLIVNYQNKVITEQTVKFNFIETAKDPEAFTVRVAGTLEELIPEEMADTLTTLTVTGRLCGQDFAFIRNSATIKTIDLSGASIVKGPGVYYSNLTTTDNIIGVRMFHKVVAERVVLPETATKIDNYAFYQSTNITDVVIGKNVKTIGNYAFGGCKALDRITIPASVESIGRYALKDCPLKYFICESETPFTLSTNPFDSGALANITLVVPTEAAIETYKATNVWSTFGNIISYEKYLTNISPATEDIAIAVKNGSVKIDAETEVAIYTITGKLVAKGKGGEYTLPAGCYIVKAGNKAMKVRVD